MVPLNGQKCERLPHPAEMPVLQSAAHAFADEDLGDLVEALPSADAKDDANLGDLR